MSSRNNIIVYDFETGSRNPEDTQPIQIGAIIIDYNRLEIIHNSEFVSYIKPEFDVDKCREYRLAPLENEALEINKIKRSELENAPSAKKVWSNFCNYVQNYGIKKGKWGAPIKAGYNNKRFDDIIVNRLCGGNNRLINKYLADNNLPTINEPYKFGNWDDDRNEESLFFPGINIDVLHSFIWPWTENMEQIKSRNLTSICEWLGYDASGAHDALFDVKLTADLLIRFLKMHRRFAPNVKFTNK